MKNEIVSFAGWGRNLLLANNHAEVIITLDVGPRIISYKRPGADNVFKNYEDQLGGSGESEWKIRGGHRFWIAPEDEVLSYHRDNQPLDYRVGESAEEMVFDSLQTQAGRIMKTLGVTLAENDSHVTVRHTARNDGDEPIQIASWALSVMKPGGMEIIPQPPLGEHPRDLLPNRGIVLWPYTDLTDPRWHFGKNFFTLHQRAGFPPTKIGLSHKEKWIAYIIEDSIFLKTFDRITGAIYPDGGCNFETFTNNDMLEIESLSPLASLAPGDAVSHTENWYLFPVPGEARIESEEALTNWLRPFLSQAGL
ncbi:MAG: hypothetical protein WCQ16_11910 [Verrucomicrobiae bacterium]